MDRKLLVEYRDVLYLDTTSCSQRKYNVVVNVSC